MRRAVDFSRSLRDLNPRTVGLVSLALIAVVVAGAIGVGTLGIFKNQYTMSGVFPDTGGLIKGDPVRVAGVIVGQVTGTTPDRQHGVVVITWTVNHGVDVGSKATADIALSTLLGGDYIRLGGPVAKPYMADLPEDKRQIPIDRTTTPFQLTGVLGTQTHTIEQLDVSSIDRMINDFGTMSQGQQVPTADLVNGFNQVAGALNARSTQLQSLSAESAQLTNALAQKDAALGQLINSSAALLNNIAQRRDQLAQILGNGSQAVNAMNQLLTTKQAQLDSLLNNLHLGLQVIAKDQGYVDKGLAWMGPTFAHTALVGTHGPWIDGLLLAAPPNAAQGLQQLLNPPAGTPGLNPPPGTP